MLSATRRVPKATEHRHVRDIDCHVKDAHWLASLILEQAVRDLTNYRRQVRLRAQEFINSNDFDYWAELIDLDTQAARDALRTRLDNVEREMTDAATTLHR